MTVHNESPTELDQKPDDSTDLDRPNAAAGRPVSPAGGDSPIAAAPMSMSEGSVPPPAADASAPESGNSSAGVATGVAESPHPGAPTGSTATDSTLFAGGELDNLRSRWDSVQAGFVDDPRQCVHQADDLVADLIEKLTAEFGQARSRLEEPWARGEDASTEDLRIALMQYRAFFDRLLAV
jgi:hypothetical protein